MCFSYPEFTFVVVLIFFIIPILISNFALSYIDRPKFKITTIYREFTKKMLEKNITSIITNELLSEKLKKNLNLMIDITTEDSYLQVFNNTELYSYENYLNNKNNFIHTFYSNKNGIEKYFFDSFYHSLENFTVYYFNSIKTNYYHKKLNNDSSFNNIYHVITDSWMMNELDIKFIEVIDKLSYLLKDNIKFKNANKNFKCIMIINDEECPYNYFKYKINKISQITKNLPMKYNYYTNKNIIECCNH